MSGPYIARVLEQELSEARVRLELAQAERDGALCAVKELIAIIGRERNEFMWPTDQATVRAAKALLAEHGVASGGEG